MYDTYQRKKKKRKKKQTNKQTLYDASWLGRKTWATKAIHISSTKEENEGKEKKIKKIKRREVEIYHCCEEAKERIDDESSGLGESKKSRSFLSFQLSQNFHPSFLSISEKSFVWT